MDWVPAAAASGGPWVLLLSTLTTVVGLLMRGTLMPGTIHDRIVKAYEKIIEDKEAEALAWKAAHAVEVEAGRVLREQNGKLLEHSSVSAHAWAGIRAVAERSQDAA